MIDGDMTYDLSAAPALIYKLQQHRLDMIIGKRIPDVGQNGGMGIALGIGSSQQR